MVERWAAECLYARIDGVRHAGAWCVMEVELIDPQLYLDDAQLVGRFADAIQTVVRR